MEYDEGFEFGIQVCELSAWEADFNQTSGGSNSEMYDVEFDNPTRFDRCPITGDDRGGTEFGAYREDDAKFGWRFEGEHSGSPIHIGYLPDTGGTLGSVAISSSFGTTGENWEVNGDLCSNPIHFGRYPATDGEDAHYSGWYTTDAGNGGAATHDGWRSDQEGVAIQGCDDYYKGCNYEYGELEESPAKWVKDEYCDIKDFPTNPHLQDSIAAVRIPAEEWWHHPPMEEHVQSREDWYPSATAFSGGYRETIVAQQSPASYNFYSPEKYQREAVHNGARVEPKTGDSKEFPNAPNLQNPAGDQWSRYDYQAQSTYFFERDSSALSSNWPNYGFPRADCKYEILIDEYPTRTNLQIPVEAPPTSHGDFTENVAKNDPWKNLENKLVKLISSFLLSEEIIKDEEQKQLAEIDAKVKPEFPVVEQQIMATLCLQELPKDQLSEVDVHFMEFSNRDSLDKSVSTVLDVGSDTPFKAGETQDDEIDELVRLREAEAIDNGTIVSEEGQSIKVTQGESECEAGAIGIGERLTHSSANLKDASTTMFGANLAASALVHHSLGKLDLNYLDKHECDSQIILFLDGDSVKIAKHDTCFDPGIDNPDTTLDVPGLKGLSTRSDSFPKLVVCGMANDDKITMYGESLVDMDPLDKEVVGLCEFNETRLIRNGIKADDGLNGKCIDPLRCYDPGISEHCVRIFIEEVIAGTEVQVWSLTVILVERKLHENLERLLKSEALMRCDHGILEYILTFCDDGEFSYGSLCGLGAGNINSSAKGSRSISFKENMKLGNYGYDSKAVSLTAMQWFLLAMGGEELFRVHKQSASLKSELEENCSQRCANWDLEEKNGPEHQWIIGYEAAVVCDTEGKFDYDEREQKLIIEFWDIPSLCLGHTSTSNCLESIQHWGLLNLTLSSTQFLVQFGCYSAPDTLQKTQLRKCKKWSSESVEVTAQKRPEDYSRALNTRCSIFVATGNVQDLCDQQESDNSSRENSSGDQGHKSSTCYLREIGLQECMVCVETIADGDQMTTMFKEITPLWNFNKGWQQSCDNDTSYIVKGTTRLVHGVCFLKLFLKDEATRSDRIYEVQEIGVRRIKICVLLGIDVVFSGDQSKKRNLQHRKLDSVNNSPVVAADLEMKLCLRWDEFFQQLSPASTELDQNTTPTKFLIVTSRISREDEIQARICEGKHLRSTPRGFKIFNPGISVAFRELLKSWEETTSTVEGADEQGFVMLSVLLNIQHGTDQSKRSLEMALRLLRYTKFAVP